MNRSAQFKLSTLPTLLTVWWAGQGAGAIDWKTCWFWCVGLVVSTWIFWWGVACALFPNLKFSSSNRRVIARMHENLTEADGR